MTLGFLTLIASRPSLAACPQSADGLVTPRPGDEVSLNSEFRFIHPLEESAIFTLESSGFPVVDLSRDALSDYVVAPTRPLTENANYVLFRTFGGCLEECRERIADFDAAARTQPAIPAPIIEYAGVSQTPGLFACEDSFNGPVTLQESREARDIEIRLVRPENSASYRPVVTLIWKDAEVGIERLLVHAPPTGEMQTSSSGEDLFGAYFSFLEAATVTEARVVIHYVDMSGQIGPEAESPLEFGLFPFGCSELKPIDTKEAPLTPMAMLIVSFACGVFRRRLGKR